jgi:hypothetical protein
LALNKFLPIFIFRRKSGSGSGVQSVTHDSQPEPLNLNERFRLEKSKT